MSRQRHRLMAQAILLGMLTGAVAVGFHISLDCGEALRNRIVALAHQHAAAGPWLILGLAMTAVVCSAGLILRFAPEASGSGIPHLKAVLQGRGPFRWLRVLVLKFVSTVIGVTGGLVLGRGGPSVHMGGAVGQGVANLWPGKNHEDRSILVAAGGGAGLAAAFNAPLAGLVFVLEELEWRCASLEFFTAAIACLTAMVLIIEMTGNYALILPLFIACFAALLVADWAGFLPIYEALLERDLKKGRFKRTTVAPAARDCPTNPANPRGRHGNLPP